MRTFILASMLFSAGLAFAKGGPGGGGHGHGGHGGPGGPDRPRPECVRGDEAKAIFDQLDVEGRVITNDDLTVTIKRTRGTKCREVSSENGVFYTCCVRPNADAADNETAEQEAINELDESADVSLQ